jgi:hypothetical protein
MAVPNTFASATTSIPLANLDANFAYYDAAYSIVSTTINFLGNVGIGTASPAVKLQVTTSGVAALPASSGTAFSTGTLIRLGTSSDSAGGIGTIGLATNQMWIQVTDSTNLGVGNSLLLNPNGGNVGIGTTTPSFKLVIKQASGDTQFAIQGAVKNWNLRNQADGTYGLFDDSLGYWRYMYDASNNHIWFNGASTERMRIDSSGNVGIGTTSPSSYGLLSVASSTAGSAKISIQDTSGGASPAPLIQFGVNSSNGFNTADAARVWTTSPSSSTAALNFAAYSGGAPSTAQMTLTGGNVGIGTTSPSQKLTLDSGFVQTGNGIGGAGGVWFPYGGDAGTRTWRARTDLVAYGDWGLEQSTTQTGTTFATKLLMTNDGRFYVNQTAGNGNTAQRMGVTYNGAAEWALAIQTTESTGGNSISFQNSSGTQVGVINQSNTATSYITSSDYRLKEDIAPMTGALAKVALLKPVTYKWKSDGSDAEGFIAHELAEVCPAAVCGAKDATKTVEIKDEEGNVIGTEAQPVYQGIDTSFLVATLTAAIQEQQALITSLTARIVALESN